MVPTSAQPKAVHTLIYNVVQAHKAPEYCQRLSHHTAQDLLPVSRTKMVLECQLNKEQHTGLNTLPTGYSKT